MKVKWCNAIEVWTNASKIPDQHKESHKVDLIIRKYRLRQFIIENNLNKESYLHIYRKQKSIISVYLAFYYHYLKVY